MASPATPTDPPPAPAPRSGAARRVLRSFGYAFEGLGVIVRTQPNFSVHLGLALLALALAYVFGLSAVEVAVLVAIVGLVLAAEAINTALEALCDLASPTYHPLAKRAKDAAAAAVLIAAIAAVCVALALFGPRILSATATLRRPS